MRHIALGLLFFCASTSEPTLARQAPDQAPEPDSAQIEPADEATRAGRRLALRRLKAQTLHPPIKSRLERGLYWVETKGLAETGRLNFYNFYPKFGGLSTGSGYAFGTRYWNPNLRDGPLDAQGSAAASFRGYQLFDFQFGELQPPQRGFSYHLNLRYRDYPQEDFFGLGPDSLETNRSDYRLRDGLVEGAIGYQFRRAFRADLQAGWLRSRISPGTDERYVNTEAIFDEAEAPGLDARPDYFRLRASVRLDYRDQPGSPRSGGTIGVGFSRFQQLDGNDFEFSRYRIDASHFFSLKSTARVLALRFYTTLDTTADGSRVPFYLQESLGGSEMLRGFREFRFRDANLLFLSAEYRWEVLQAAEFALFYDAGKVFPDRGGFDLSGLRRSWGVGLRVKTRDAIVFRIDAARSAEGSRIYFKFGPSF